MRHERSMAIPRGSTLYARNPSLLAQGNVFVIQCNTTRIKRSIRVPGSIHPAAPFQKGAMSKQKIS